MPGLFAREGAELVANSTRFDDQRRPKVVKLANGNFVVVWDDFSRQGGDTDLEAVRAQLFDRDGTPLGGEILVNTTTDRSQVDSKAAALSSGGFVVTWTDYNTQPADNSSSAVKAQMFDAAGAKTGPELLVNTTTAGYQMYPAVSQLPDGGFVAVWVDVQGLLSLQGNIRGQRFDASGAKVGQEFEVNSLADNRQTSPHVATLADGKFVVTWTDGTPGTLDGSGSSVRGQMFNADGSRVGGEFQVNEMANGGQQAQSVTALAGGGFIAIWNDLQGFPGSELFDAGGSALEAQIFDADGNRVGGEFVINPLRRTNQSGATIAAMEDGGFIVSWNDFGYSNGHEIWSHIAAQAFDAQGERLGDQFYLENHQSVHNQTALAALDGGRFVAVWHGGTGSAYHNNYPGDIRVQLFSPAAGVSDIGLSSDGLSETHPNNVFVGTLAATSEAVNTRVSYAIVEDETGTGFRIEGNRLVVADNSKLDFETNPTITLTIRAYDGAGGHHDEVVQLALSDAALEQRWTATDEIQVNRATGADQFEPAIAGLADGGHVMVWTDYSGVNDPWAPSVKVQLYDSAGAKKGGEFVVNWQIEWEQYEPAVAALASGGFVVTWSDRTSYTDQAGARIKAQLFDAAGARVGTEFIVQSDAGAPGDQHASQVAALEAGGFVVVWHDSGAGAGGAIKARLFNAAGEAPGGDVTVNSDAAGAPDQPALAALSAGGFVVTWTGADADGRGIRAQMFDAAGNQLGSEFLVNSATAGNQTGSAVTGLASGGFLVTWDVLGFGGSEVRGQLFDASGAKSGAEFVVDGAANGAAATPLDNGGFVIAWQDHFGGSGELVSVNAQVFDAAGRRVGGEWLVNENLPGNQMSPALATLASGAVILAWTDPDARADGSGSSVRARTFFDPREIGSPPVAAADWVTVSEAATLGGSVFLDNGSGPDRGVPRIAEVNGETANVGRQITLASGALLTLNANGSFSYDPNGAFGALVDAASGAANSAAMDGFSYTLEGGSTAEVAIQVTGITSSGEPFIGSAAKDVISGTADGDLFRLEQGGDDYAAGGAGDDLFYFGAAMNWLDQTGGGAGDDQVLIQGGYQTHFGTGAFFEVETLVLLSSQDRSFGGGSASGPFSYSLSLLDAAITIGHSLQVDAAGLLAGETLSLDGSAETDGTLTVRSGAANDIIKTGAGDDSLNGGDGADALHGGSGDDLLNGGRGADLMDGGSGDDSYVLDTKADRIVEAEGGGTDTILSRIGFSLPEYFENLTLTGGAMIDARGNSLANILIGNGAINRLDGGAGADTMSGGLGHDIYVVDMSADKVVEYGSSGNDTVESSISFTLPVHVEKLVLTGGGGVTGRGNGAANRLTGNGAGNRLDGAGGDDAIDGSGGNDLVYGGIGNDSLRGGAGLDRFMFNAALGGSNVDRILDFSPVDDRIDLHRAIFAKAGANGVLAAGAFQLGSTAQDAGDRIIYDRAAGHIFYDADGTGAAAQLLFATVAAGTALTSADFFLYG